MRLKLLPYEPSLRKDFERSGFPTSILKEHQIFDLILIDGQEIQGFAARTQCFFQAQKKIKKGGIIIVDDYWRYHTLTDNHSAREMKVFSGIEPGRKGLTSTSIFYY